MSNEIDLDWLVRNVHVWPESTPHIIPAGDCVFEFGATFCENHVCLYHREFADSKVIHKHQWLARRAELQNKPSWKDAPEWATHLGQNILGLWTFTEFRPEPNYCGGWSMSVKDGRRHCTNLLDGQEGEVLGDWRDTLERRPVDLSEQAVTQRLDEATQNVLAAVPGLMDEKYLFDPEFRPATVSNETAQLEQPVAVAGTGNGSASESAFLIGRVIDLLRTSADHFSANELADLNQLCDAELTKRDERVCGGQKYIDAHWFERGELPPVGARCIVLLGIAPKANCEVIAKTARQMVVKWEENGLMDVIDLDVHVAFRPIPTERDVLIEIIKNTDDTDDKIADAIMAAGFSLRGK